MVTSCGPPRSPVHGLLKLATNYYPYRRDGGSSDCGSRGNAPAGAATTSSRQVQRVMLRAESVFLTAAMASRSSQTTAGEWTRRPLQHGGCRHRTVRMRMDRVHMHTNGMVILYIIYIQCRLRYTTTTYCSYYSATTVVIRATGTVVRTVKGPKPITLLLWGYDTALLQYMRSVATHIIVRTANSDLFTIIIDSLIMCCFMFNCLR